jgi:hypothetical protein
MTIRAGGRVALIAATGLLVCVAGVSGTIAAPDTAEQKSESVSTSNKVKHALNHKRDVHRKQTRTAQESSEDQKPAEVEKSGAVEFVQAGAPSELPATVANANAKMASDAGDQTARAMTARANALLGTEQAPEPQGAEAATMQVVEADQLNDVDKGLQEPPAPASPTTIAVAPAKPAAMASTVAQETSTWDQTSLIGKIFIAFGALLTIASAARMFMA